MITIVEINKIIGDTWFDISIYNEVVTIDTRDNGNVGDEEAGEKDIEEGYRIAKLLKPFVKNVNSEIVDEWVIVEFRAEEFKEKKL